MQVRNKIPFTGFYSYIKEVLTGVIVDCKNGLFKVNKWHWHSLIGFVLGFGIQYLFEPLYNPDVPAGWQFILSAFGTFVSCWVWEWGQGILGANKTKTERFEADKDIAVGVICGIIGIITALLL